MCVCVWCVCAYGVCVCVCVKILHADDIPIHNKVMTTILLNNVFLVLTLCLTICFLCKYKPVCVLDSTSWVHVVT